jgi:hypothetical protein
LTFQLATTLHRLDYMSPNGGKRVPEAAKLYRYAGGQWGVRGALEGALCGYAWGMVLGGRVRGCGESQALLHTEEGRILQRANPASMSGEWGYTARLGWIASQ